MTKPTVFNYKNYEELRQAYKELLADNQQLIADNRKLRKEVTELKQLNDGYVKIIAKNQETNNKLMASVQKQTGGDYISRADAIEALCHNCAYYTDAQCKTYSGYWCESGAMIREDIPSADTVEVDRTSEWVAVRREEYEDLIADAEAVQDCRNCKYGSYNDHLETWFCNQYCECSNWDLWESADAVQGEWLEEYDDDGVICSVCGKVHGALFSYCPSCGARMENKE